MSRAFVREDVQVLELERLEFQAFLAASDAPVHQTNDLNALLRWAKNRGRGFVQIRDRFGVLLAEISESN